MGTLPYTDALAYYDRDIDTKQGVRAAVEQEIEAEKQRFEPAEYLEPAPELFSVRPFPNLTNPALRAELERVARGEKLAAIDTSRYQVSRPEGGDADAWAAALDNAAVQVGHMEVRVKNVELLRRYGANLWRLHNYQQEAMAAFEQREADEISEETDRLNRARRDAQLRVGDKLSVLQNRWAGLVSKNLSLSAANLTARADIDALSQRKLELEAELARLDAQT